MNPAELALLALVQSAAMLALGYWLGLRKRSAKSAPVRSSAASVRAMPRRSEFRPMPRVHATVDTSERLRRDIESRVQALRKARETAAPWTPPPVDRVDSSRSLANAAAWFADTQVEPEAARRAG